MALVQVGIREIKAHLSGYLKRVKHGESIEITEWGKPVARLEPVAPDPDAEMLRLLVREGAVSWNGKKPSFSKKRIQVKGKPISETILEDRGAPLS